MEGLRRWNEVLGTFLAAIETAPDTAYDRLSEPLIAATRDVWQRPVQTWGDLAPLLAVAVHWNSPVEVGDPPWPYDILKAQGHSFDEYAPAMLARAVLQLLGLHFDADGRLLGIFSPEPWREDPTMVNSQAK